MFVPSTTTHGSGGLAHALSLPRIPGLDFLRAAAVLSVMLDHSGAFQFVYLDGVQIFFVLSGFLITFMLLAEQEERRTIDLVRFYVRRVARLLPVFYFYLLVGLIILFFRHQPIPWAAVASSAAYVINYYQAFTGASAHYLSHCWSLAVEEQFYIIWPALLLFVTHRRWPLLWCGAVLVLFIWLLRYLYIAFGVPDEYLYRSLETRMDQLAIGGVAAVLTRRADVVAKVDRLNPRSWLALALLMLVASFRYLRDSIFAKYGVAYMIEPLLIAFALPLTIMAASQSGLVANLLNNRLLTMIGQVSYGMYLFHQIVMHATRNALERAGVDHGLSIAASMITVFLCAWISFTFLESPIRTWIRGLMPSR